MHNQRDVLHDQRQKALVPVEAPRVPTYLVCFGIPPYIAVIIVSSIYPMAGLALLTVLTVMVVTLKVLFHYGS